MDSHFDTSVYHPTFTDGFHNHEGGNFLNVSMDSFLAASHEYGLPDDVVFSAAHEACRFFNLMDIPIEHSPSTCVNLGNPYIYEDDRLGFSREQLLGMNVHDHDTLSLIFTHEQTHRALQLMWCSGQISDWQNELICDAFVGVRAEMEGLDAGPVRQSLSNGIDCPTHPGFDLRDAYITHGVEIVREFRNSGIEPGFDDVMSRLNDHLMADRHNIALREMAAKQSAGC